MGHNVAVVGCTGAVGLEMTSILEQRNFPVDNLRFMAVSSQRLTLSSVFILYRASHLSINPLSSES